MKPLISFDQFAAMDIRIGKILECEVKEGSEKLYRLKVNFGEEGERIILSGIQQFFTPEELIGKQFVFIINIEPRKIMGELSNGMILAADGEKPIPLIPQTEAVTGSFIR
jgi:methionyl-tRNA synthetase